jgi:hypothetical protein
MVVLFVLAHEYLSDQRIYIVMSCHQSRSKSTFSLAKCRTLVSTACSDLAPIRNFYRIRHVHQTNLRDHANGATSLLLGRAISL